MTAWEALWVIKSQLTKTPQNLEAIEVLQDVVGIVNRLRVDDDEKTYTLQEAFEYLELGTEAEHIKNHMNKVAKKDIEELHERDAPHKPITEETE